MNTTQLGRFFQHARMTSIRHTVPLNKDNSGHINHAEVEAVWQIEKVLELLENQRLALLVLLCASLNDA